MSLKVKIVMEDPKYLALVGPAGIGKGTSFKAIMDHFTGFARVVPKVTTREPRPGESDTIAGIPVPEFLTYCVDNGKKAEIVLPHQPFGTDWYGYYRQDLFDFPARLNLVEPHVEFQLPEFRKIFAGKALVVALTTRNSDYLRHNLRQRGTDSPEAVDRRIQAAERLIPIIYAKHQAGEIDHVIELDWGNRSLLRAQMVHLAGKLLNLDTHSFS